MHGKEAVVVVGWINSESAKVDSGSVVLMEINLSTDD
jgi:hypothetical protein